MSTVFISGSIKIKSLDEKLKARLDSILDADLKVVVGDAGGVDKSVQIYLKAKNTKSVVVYCSGDSPRNNEGCWPVVNVATHHAENSREFFTAKDLKMTEAADFGLMVWDSKSTGTLKNVCELLAKGKKSVVYVAKEKAFLNIGGVKDLKILVSLMSPLDRINAEKKLGISSRFVELEGSPQSDMFSS